jgi:hypothetical protein
MNQIFLPEYPYSYKLFLINLIGNHQKQTKPNKKPSEFSPISFLQRDLRQTTAKKTTGLLQRFGHRVPSRPLKLFNKFHSNHKTKSFNFNLKVILNRAANYLVVFIHQKIVGFQKEIVSITFV